MTRYPVGIRLTAGEVRERFSQDSFQHDARLSTLDSEAYVSTDRLLFVSRGGGGLEHDYAAWMTWRREAEARLSSQLRGGYVDPLWDGTERSAANMLRLAEQLAQILGLEQSMLDYSRGSLRAVDRELGCRPREWRSGREVFSALAAYTGEVLRRCLGEGRWDFDGSGWPSIVSRHGNVFALVKLFEEMTETRVRTPTQMFVNTALGSIRNPGPD